MNPGLLYLLRMKPVGWWRAIGRRFTGTKRFLLVAGILALFAVLVGPQIMLAAHASAEDTIATTVSIRIWGPAVLMLLAVFGMSSGTGLLFQPSEIDLLFPAPLSRRELLCYHVVGKLSVVLLSSLWMALFTLRWASCWYGGFVGLFFGLAFLQLTSQFASLLLASFSVRINKGLRRIVTIGFVGLCVVATVIAMQQRTAESSFADGLAEIVNSDASRLATAPARVFIEIFASETVLEFGKWSAAGLAILVLLFGLILVFDVAYSDGALRLSRKVQERLRRMRSGGGPLLAPVSSSVRFSLPAFPWLGGAGPMAWRQGIEALRSLRGILFTALFTVGLPVVFVTASRSEADGSGAMGFGVIIMMTVVMTQNLALDFRRDVDRMVFLKSLPLPPAYVALGQILPGILILTLLQSIAIAALVLALGIEMPWPTSMLLLLLPFNWLSMALDNLLFLWFPYRFAPKEAGNVQFMFRPMMVLMVKMFALMAGIGVAAGLASLAWWLSGESMWLAALTATVVVSAEAAVFTIWLGRAFARFDATKDVP